MKSREQYWRIARAVYGYVNDALHGLALPARHLTQDAVTRIQGFYANEIRTKLRESSRNQSVLLKNIRGLTASER